MLALDTRMGEVKSKPSKATKPTSSHAWATARPFDQRRKDIGHGHGSSRCLCSTSDGFEMARLRLRIDSCEFQGELQQETLGESISNSLWFLAKSVKHRMPPQ